MELWKEIKGYEGYYEISSFGKVRSIRRNKILKTEISPKGYERVGLMKQGKRKVYRVHRLVAEMFIENPCNYPQINHIDENKTNNIVNNLEWCSAKYNMNYGNVGKKRKPVLQYSKDGTFISRYDSIADAEKATNIITQSISRCAKGKRKSANGFIWKFEGV